MVDMCTEYLVCLEQHLSLRRHLLIASLRPRINYLTTSRGTLPQPHRPHAALPQPFQERDELLCAAAHLTHRSEATH
jgi:hypothetical protein